MTYETIIQRLRFRMRDVKNVPLLYYEDGALFTIVNEGVRELYRKTKDYEKSADLTLVVDQSEYDVASEIGTDVGEIFEIRLTDGTNGLSGEGLKPFNDRVQRGTVSFDSTTSTDVTTPGYFRVWEETLKIYPTPTAADTATVYYFAKEPLLDYSNANLTLQVRLNEEYLESLLTYCKGVVYEIAGDEAKADKKKLTAFAMIDEVKANKTSYDHTSVDYQEVI